jgi:CheY-like chemotaxis protein
MTILVVDDEPQYRLLLDDFLRDEGHNVLTAENGEDALEKMAEMKVDFVISDVYMPVLDGVKFHRMIREIPGYEELPFLFVSAFDDQHTLDAVRNSKFDGFLKKGRPVSVLKQWITYLTLPVDKRPLTRPGSSQSLN